MDVRTHIQSRHKEWCYTCLYRNPCQYPPPENEVMVLQNCLRWYFVTSPRPEPERVQPMKLYVIIFYQQTMRTFIISSTKCRRDRKPFAPPLTSIPGHEIMDEHLSYKSYSIRIYPPHLRPTPFGRCRQYHEHYHRNHYGMCRNKGFLNEECCYKSYSIITLLT